jgi:hypothetical protein
VLAGELGLRNVRCLGERRVFIALRPENHKSIGLNMKEDRDSCI